MINSIFLSESSDTTKLQNIIKEQISKMSSANKNIDDKINEEAVNKANLLVIDFADYIYYFVLISKSDYRDNFYKQNCDSYNNALNEIKLKIENIIKENNTEVVDSIIKIWLKLFKTIELEANELNYNYKLVEDAVREINYLHQNI